MGVSASDYRARVSHLADVLILWDIDGTLVTHAPASRDRHAHAVGSVLGHPVDRLPAGVGKTDRQIIIELFADHLPSDDELASALRVIDEVTAEDMRTSPSTATDGAAELLSHLAHAGASQSVLTGNTPERARLKVTTAHLADHIDFDSGFYGDVHSTRMELVAAAAEQLSLQKGLQPVIVGDTPLDILAAHASGFPVIATTTGIFDATALQEHRPDAVVFDFSDARAFAETISAIVSR